jgi:hypothetical protein
LHLRPEHEQLPVENLTTHRPEPRGETTLTGPRLERLGRGRRSAVMEREARSVLHHRAVVHERGLVESRPGARVIDERVLEQPERPPAAQRVHVLVVEPEHGADALAEEPVERDRRRTGGTSHIGRDESGARRSRR